MNNFKFNCQLLEFQINL